MENKFTAIIEKDGEWFIAYCPDKLVHKICKQLDVLDIKK